MAYPTTRPVTILINSVDRTASIPIKTLDAMDAIGQQLDDCSFIVEDGGGMSLAVGQEVIIHKPGDSATKYFGGVIARMRSWAMGPERNYEISCDDFTWHMDNPEDLVSGFYNSMSDAAIIDSFMDGACSQIDDTTHVSVVTADTVRVEFLNKTPRECVQYLANISGAMWYVDYDKKLHFFVTGANDAPYDLTDDDPNLSTTFGFKNMEVVEEAPKANRVIVIGRHAAATATRTLGAEGDYGHWITKVLRDDNIFTAAQAAAVGDKFLADAAEADVVTCSVLEPGLRSGMTIQVTNTVLGFSATTFEIQNVRKEFKKGGSVKYYLTLGKYLSSFDEQVVNSENVAAVEQYVTKKTGKFEQESSDDGTQGALHNLVSYNTNVGLASAVRLLKSHTAVVGTKVATIDTEELGWIQFNGVDAEGDVWTEGVLILATQIGAAGSSYVGAKLETFVRDDAGNALVWTLDGPNQLAILNDADLDIRDQRELMFTADGETVDEAQLGQISMYGVDVAGIDSLGARIRAEQEGRAGFLAVPAQLSLAAYAPTIDNDENDGDYGQGDTVLTDGSGTISLNDTVNDLETLYKTAAGDSTYVIVAHDEAGNAIYGYIRDINEEIHDELNAGASYTEANTNIGAGTATMGIDDTNLDMSLLYEGCKITAVDEVAKTIVGYVRGISKTGDAYTFTIYNAATGGTQNWTGDTGDFDITDAVTWDIEGHYVLDVWDDAAGSNQDWNGDTGSFDITDAIIWMIIELAADFLVTTLMLDGPNKLMTLTEADFEMISGGTDTRPVVFLSAYNDQIVYPSLVILRKSHTDTLRTLTTTITNERFGEVQFHGVDTGNNFRLATYIRGSQNGAAGANTVPGVLELWAQSGMDLETADAAINLFAGGDLNIEAAGGAMSLAADTDIDVEADSGAFNLVAGTSISISCNGGQSMNLRSEIDMNIQCDTGAMSLTAAGGVINLAAAINNDINISVSGTGIVDVNGDLDISGTLTKGAGAFRIDHPLYPDTHWLHHSMVESPDMKNLYDGLARLDKNGMAWVTLPAYFEALNRDFRYQLTPVGAAMTMLHVGSKIEGNRFLVAGGQPSGMISWQVTGIRQDRFANENRIQVEVRKTDD